MKKRIEYFGSNPVRYLRDESGLDYVCVQDLREACDPASFVVHSCGSAVH